MKYCLISVCITLTLFSSAQESYFFKNPEYLLNNFQMIPKSEEDLILVKQSLTYDVISRKGLISIYKEKKEYKKTAQAELTYQNDIVNEKLKQQRLKYKNQSIMQRNRYLLGGGILLLLGVVVYILSLLNRLKKNQLKNVKSQLSKKSFEKQQTSSNNQFLNDIKNESSSLQTNLVILNKTTIEKDWLAFTVEFDKQYDNFLSGLEQEYPELTVTNLRLAALVKLKLSNKEIADVLNITENGVKKAKQRFREKIAAKKFVRLHQLFD